MISTLRSRLDTPAPAPTPGPAPAAGADADFSYNAQDKVVFASGTTTLHNVSAQADGTVSTPQVALSSKLTPNNGSYVYADADPADQTAANAFAAVNKTVQAFGKALGQPVTFAFSAPQLGVVPDGGEDFNAYYARDSGNVNFFHGTDPVTKQIIYSGNSGEVVSHETGHAILDGQRPAYFSSFTPDVAAFHEAFGDTMGILMSFQDDRTLDKVVAQTGGDLTKDNAIADTGEELGIAINDVEGGADKGTGGPYVRTALNTFKWADPSSLGDGGPSTLGSEAHSFSRLWTGAFYDVLTAIQAQNMASGMDAKTALKATGDTAISLVANLVKGAPQGDFTYRDMAKAFVASDKANGGKFADIITKAYTDRGILTPDAPTPTPAPTPAPVAAPTPALARPSSSIFTMTQDGPKPLSDVTHNVRTRLSGSEFGIFQGAAVETPVDNDGSLTKDAEVGTRTRQNLKNLIDSGRIRYNDPSYQMKKSDYFDAKGRPYVGVVRWVDGEMTIERVKIAD